MLLSYQLMFFILVENNFMKPNSLILRISLFFVSILIGFIIAFIAYAIDSINFLILGIASGAQIAFIYGSFYVDFHSNK